MDFIVLTIVSFSVSPFQSIRNRSLDVDRIGATDGRQYNGQDEGYHRKRYTRKCHQADVQVMLNATTSNGRNTPLGLLKVT